MVHTQSGLASPLQSSEVFLQVPAVQDMANSSMIAIFFMFPVEGFKLRLMYSLRIYLCFKFSV